MCRNQYAIHFTPEVLACWPSMMNEVPFGKVGLKATMDSMTLLIPPILQVKIPTVKNYKTEMNSHLMSIKAVPDSPPCLTSELSRELSTEHQYPKGTKHH